jgi:flagellar export protein FliJ
VSGPSFRFRLERVRVVRERTESLAKQELARAIQRREGTEAELRRVDEHLQQAHSEHRSVAAESRTLSADELTTRQAFIERVEVQRGQRAQELQQREREVVHRDADLAAAASEHEMLNRLRERDRGEHDREAARLERNLIDEIATVRFRRGHA